MYRSAALIIGVLVVAAAAGCGTGNDIVDGETSVISSSPAAATTSPTPSATPSIAITPSTTGPTGAPTLVMPNLVGWVLQDAQDEMQRITGNPLFLTTSSDATGQGRVQLIDRNWKVCGQNVPAGAPITLHTPIDFSVVKLEENCP